MTHQLPSVRVQYMVVARRAEFSNDLRRRGDAGCRPNGSPGWQLRGREIEEAWHADYENVASAAQNLISTAQRVGALLWECATLLDLTEATRRCRTVVLFAHWSGAQFAPGDLLAEPGVLSQRLAQHACFRGLCASDTRGIVDLLNGAIEDMRLLHELPASVSVSARRSRSIGQTLSRDLLDEYLRGLVAPGNRLELFGGLYTPDDVEQAVAADFQGDLDLALCHSEALGTFLDLRRGDKQPPTLAHYCSSWPPVA